MRARAATARPRQAIDSLGAGLAAPFVQQAWASVGAVTGAGDGDGKSYDDDGDVNRDGHCGGDRGCLCA